MNSLAQPLVSVVIPCLNRASFLGPTIESVLQQDYPKVECIIIDGGSSDGTLDILRSYGERIRWVSEPDRGHADGINKGWRMSRGEVLAWLNADDVWVVPGAVRTAVDYLAAHPDTDVVYGDCGAIDADGELAGMSYLHPWDLEYAVEFCDHCIPQPAAFMRRSVLEKVGWLDTSFVSKKDHELWLRIALAGSIEYLPVLLAHARITPGYMALRGDVTAAACVALTRKFFTLPDVPAGLRSKRKLALSNAYLRGMEYAWQDGRHWRVVLAYGARAALLELSNAQSVLRRVAAYAGVRGHLSPFRACRRLALHAKQLAMGETSLRVPNLLGDRDIEWSWVASEIPLGPGEALDFGAGDSPLGLIAAERGFQVTAVDLQEMVRPYRHPGLKFLRGDLMKLPLHGGSFDLIINCSTVEHVGLAGRYAVTEPRPDGDLEAMARLRTLLKPSGRMLLTIPVGRDAVFDPLCRVYGERRLPRLLDGYFVEKEHYWVKDAENRWMQSDKGAALSFEAFAGSWDPLQNVYALGCFTMRRP